MARARRISSATLALVLIYWHAGAERPASTDKVVTRTRLRANSRRFQIQLSTTFLDLIAERRVFYQDEGLCFSGCLPSLMKQAGV
jgi:hypothetical protein